MNAEIRWMRSSDVEQHRSPLIWQLGPYCTLLTWRLAAKNVVELRPKEYVNEQ